ncbi:PQQ-binding-like beta-propeller repeat protein [Streptomyces sp. NPDC058086]|uniref:outer membrane protein assembly factor BamB family protein n=1 Tax=Streptomyces sp. NPDC058086 TaxID=3346334 RepID=UPI0036E81FC6
MAVGHADHIVYHAGPPIELAALHAQQEETYQALTRSLEQQAELERTAHNSAKLVLILTGMVYRLDRLNRTATEERDQLRARHANPAELKRAEFQFARAMEQEKRAKAELRRAQDKQRQAEELATRVAEQLRMLTSELDRLRTSAGAGEGPATPPRTVPAPHVASSLLEQAVGDDIDQALARAEAVNDADDQILQLITRELAGTVEGVVEETPGRPPQRSWTSPMRMRFPRAKWGRIVAVVLSILITSTSSSAQAIKGVNWQYFTGSAIFSRPAVADGTVYINSGDGNVYAIDANGGWLKWRTTISGILGSGESSPAVADGSVYVGSKDGRLYALDTSNGAVRWQPSISSSPIESSPTVADGTVYIGTREGKVYAIDATTHLVRWSRSTGDVVTSSPAVANGVVYVGSWDGKVYAFNADTGKPRWQYLTGGRVESSPAVAGGTVYIGSDDAKVYAINADTGEFLWRSYDTGSRAIESSPAVADGAVYVGSDDGKVYAISTSTHRVLWSHPTGDIVKSSPAVANGVVYVGSNDGKVYALYANTGDVCWSRTIGGWVYSSPVVADGTVYVGSRDAETVYAFRARG